jgi:ABC-type nitrate/sulfonate/bicarbonate transport system substrate-binding protein
MKEKTMSNPLPLTEDKKIWYTRCPVPAASGVAFQLGWLSAAYVDEGITVEALQDASPDLARHHFDHELVGLFREGGNIPAIAARAAGAPTRLIGLTWIEEGQSIVVRPDSGLHTPLDLAGKRIAIPAATDSPATSFPRGMALHGFQQALQLAGLSLDDVVIIEVPNAVSRLYGPREDRFRARSSAIEALLAGRVDAVYGKGSGFADQVAKDGLVVAVDLDALPDLRLRVNNGTPRPITVHERLLDERPDLVVSFLAASLRASDWASDHPVEVREILQEETFAEASGVNAAYGPNFHRNLHPSLSEERLELFAIQKQFLYAHGFLQHDFDLESWVARGPIEEAQSQVANASAVSV